MNKKEIGEIIAACRKSKNLTQEKLAIEVELSRSYISDLEAGRYLPSLGAMTKIALRLGIDLNFLTRMSEIQVNK